MRHLVPALILLSLATPPAHAQEPVALAEVLRAFLPDSADPAPRVLWTTGETLPIRWTTPAPVPAEYLRARGMSHRREGKVLIAKTDGRVEGRLITQGIPATVMQALVTWNVEELPIDSALAGLARAGFALRPLKCDRATEGYSFGNVVYLARVPGKRPQGLHLDWNCGDATGCLASFTVLYRRADVERVECAGS